MRGKKRSSIRLLVAVFSAVIMVLPSGEFSSAGGKDIPETLRLPDPQYEGPFSVESTLLRRRSVRRYMEKPLTLAEISQLLWAAQGVTHDRGYRTAPSAGALYPLEVYVIAGNVTGLAAGVYRYMADQHALLQTVKGDKRAQLCRAALNQTSIKNAPAVIVFCAVYQRVTIKYGRRGIRYVFMEVGHSAQNVCLQAVSLGLGTVTIGAFADDRVTRIINCRENEDPLYIMPVGKLKK
jgi:SagB-type dehydrogenase family enzyme